MQEQRPVFSQEQRLKLSPRLFQSIKLMELPVMDLRGKIEAELTQNPALEMLEDRGTVSLDEETAPPPEDDYFEATSDSGIIRQGGQAAADEQRRFIEGVLSRPETLQQHLLWQLQLELADEELRAIAEILIQNLDHDGFHKEPPETLFKQGGAFPVIPPPRLAEAVKLVQGLDPAGCCTGDYRESLKVQIELLPNAPPGIEKALDCLEQLEREKFADVARQTGCGEEEVRGFFEQIKELSPFPGRRFAPEETRFVVPDIQVVREKEPGGGDSRFVIVLNDEEIPVLGINPFFMKIAHMKVARKRRGDSTDDDNGDEDSGGGGSRDGDRPVRDFARENVKEARWFIQSVNQRNHTLLRVTRAIVEFQRSFFENGPKYLAPLTLSDIAGELGIHETTVSRTANSKYIQTEYGIFELRYFFTNSISGARPDGSRFSNKGVKEIIKEIVDSETRRLSDQEISDLLSRRGVLLARRTVAKYRKELDMGSSYTR